MKASALEFRLRVLVMLVVIVLGFTAPWIELLHWGSRTSAWLWLGSELGKLGISRSAGIWVVTAVLIAMAALAAILRVWGVAYLGTEAVNSSEMHAGGELYTGQVLADGPYRFVRNPLYLGSFLMVLAITLLMPSSGAAFTIVLLTFFMFRLILGEEAFLAVELGAPYAAYRRAVPRLIPSLWPRVAAGSQVPRWGRALLGEITPLGVLLSFAALSWRFNAELLSVAVLISFGVSWVVRVVLLPRSESPQAAA
jgi:protein-S-isoprenylcysteine O-methyltransferase Ste14